MQFIVQSKSPDTNFKAVVYEHANYQGRSQELPVGRYNLNQLTIGNDIISSLRVPVGVMAILYEHADFKGRTKIITQDTAYVGNDFNDIISSIVVQLCVTIYEHANYQGRSQALLPGSYNMNQLAIGNDMLSSLKVPPGLMVTLYEHADFKGRTKNFTQDTTYVGDDFNDITSGVVVAPAVVTIPKGALKYGDTIVLRSSHGKYLVAEADGHLNANRDAIGSWEKFTIVRSGETQNKTLVSYGDIISLKSCHNKYVVAEDNGTANVNRDAIGSWEKFALVRSGNTKHLSFVCGGDTISLKSWQNKYMVAEDNGSVNVNRDAIGPWEKWIVANGAYVVSIYEHANYQGKSQTLLLGRYNMNQLAIGNDVLSSLKIPNGVAVTLYEHSDFQGSTKTFTGDTAYVGDDFNDKTSSIIVKLQSSDGVSELCGAYASVAEACGAAACGAAALGASACGADACGGAACGAAACGAAARGVAVCGIDACGAAACAADACAAAVHVATACAADACGAAAGGISVCAGDACGAEAGGIQACPADACAANVCGINACPADACAADACAIDVIPIIPGI